MALTITKQQGAPRSRAFTHNLADIPGGVCINSTELTQTTLPEGTPVGKDEKGVFHVIKTAELAAPATSDTTVYTVKKGHNFKIGDFVLLKTSGKSYAITAIADNASDSNADDITVATSLGVAAEKGGALIQAAKAGASGSDFILKPVGLLGTGYDVEFNTFVNVVTIGQVDGSKISSLGAIADALPLINVI